MRFETKAIHSGRSIDKSTSSVTMPIHLSTTFERAADGSYPNEFVYSRESNPNRHALEDCLTSLEEGYDCVTFASGMAAITSLIEALPADKPRRVIMPNDMYFGIRSLLSETDIGSKFDIVIVDMTNLHEVEKAIKSAPTGLVWIETPSNPLLKVIDFEAVTKIAQQAGAYTVADNTWATPVLQRPLTLGVDFSIHSVTKYIGGHSDLMIGAVVARSDSPMLTNLRAWQHSKGAVPSPFDCWLALRGVQSLAQRMMTHCANASEIADFLDYHPNVGAVHYPGLSNHPGHHIAARQMSSFGSMLSFQVKGGQREAMAVAAKVQLVTRATSLGGTHSLIEHRASVEGSTTMAPPNLLRLSIGLEHVDDLKEDLSQALEEVK
ncbi:PLP-dependent aspartate aminotransferase family protein [Halobacillus shinanisalinarum]|uniref:PLP-dependent aspartate aminotransferase family protein n=1 Tax=Halobacillus shinanisalinarum TaxID=2932258 RepID=A0ABY4H4G7_9BACI|nr:PLP-dependent aspartate aminotransferase family protein [Halobacillus shinanisalinarum]UOQ94790.1 PLP-dependent aspartate aminotransferase family protein [Halobacillus shinanisalinarum]